jgi:hypothetical protein
MGSFIVTSVVNGTVELPEAWRPVDPESPWDPELAEVQLAHDIEAKAVQFLNMFPNEEPGDDILKVKVKMAPASFEADVEIQGSVAFPEGAVGPGGVEIWEPDQAAQLVAVDMEGRLIEHLEMFANEPGQDPVMVIRTESEWLPDEEPSPKRTIMQRILRR